ncbi:esterase-like activity of phytase family protein [Neisseria leonii]|uniref:Esterase-like activity of phytase family protein n=1 Tax=Neisseria leonii TaxID=2995413 RepID=A0A9X4E4G7_9NEIS|nr:esterase-like activity of phytase family protein [Neisseria sp. 51.81]MDD9327841.1 esterase-like activity of phytase family protein [Neisseria sp. 51.81]
MMTANLAWRMVLWGGLLWPAAAAASEAVLPYAELAQRAGVSIYHGGYGSSAVGDPADPQRFFALTDRGPNADGAEKGSKIFAVPDYAPVIGHFEIGAGGRVRLLEKIVLKRPDGKPLTGLPNPEGYGSTGEQAVDLQGRRLPEDRYGLDGEGLVVAPDGSFWVSDEYGPHIVHFSRSGVELERISPKGVRSDGRKLPAVLAKRRPNRGMEGLDLMPDGKTLVGVMQSTLNNPSRKEAVNQTLTRIVIFDSDTGRTRQYLYRQNGKGFSNSEVRAIDSHRLLINERDGKFAGDGAAQKHVYLVDLRGATDVSDAADGPNGLLVNGKTLEQSSWEELAAAGIRPVEKKLLVDLVQAVGYPHDKFEGMWLLARNRLAVVNDDDFGIDSDGRGGIRSKKLPDGRTDRSTLYVVPLRLPE